MSGRLHDDEAFREALLRVLNEPEARRWRAYHEAAHVAAQAFAGADGVHHILEVTIVPDLADDGTAGCVRNQGASCRVMSICAPDPWRKHAARKALLQTLAGYAAEVVLDPGPDPWPAGYYIPYLWEEQEEDRPDLEEAWIIARANARRGTPAGRFLRLAERWTFEMLALPAVWQTVERLAGMLLERNTLEDPDELCEVTEGITMWWYDHGGPKWRRRLCFSAAEWRAVERMAVGPKVAQ